MSFVVNYYEMIDEDNRFSRNSRRIEFLTTNFVLEKHLPPQAKILDVGAATGVYSFYYAKRQHEVVAIDITPKHIEVLKLKSEQSGIPIEAYVDNATDLSRFANESFDAVFCFGPMYHLTDEQDRQRCITECLRVLKKGGLLAVAYINKYSCIPMLATRAPQFIRDSVIQKVINDGVIREGDEDCFWTDTFFTSPEEIELLLTQHQVITIDHAGVDGISHTIQHVIDTLTDEQFDAWLRYQFETCREKNILGLSSHGLYVGRKAEASI